MSNRQCRLPLTLEDLVNRVRQEYAALPGLRLTASQVCRLWDLDPHLSRHVLQHLVERRFLTLTHAGHYVRSDGGHDTEATSASTS